MNNSVRKAAVLGWPVKHSLSPKLHGHWLKTYNIAGEYTAREVAPEHLESTLKRLHSEGYAGVNLTLPHKEAALHLVDQLDPVAKAIGAVNTIFVQKDGSLLGANTDAYGFIHNLKAAYDMTPYKSSALVIGAGGAARAVCSALLKEGWDKIWITNRTQSKAEELIAVLDKNNQMQFLPWDKRTFVLSEITLLTNTSSLGMNGQPPLALSLASLNKQALVTDIVYSPLVTPLLDEAKKRGNPVVDGLGMLLYQAQAGFEGWFGVKPEVTEDLRKAVMA